MKTVILRIFLKKIAFIKLEYKTKLLLQKTSDNKSVLKNQELSSKYIT